MNAKKIVTEFLTHITEYERLLNTVVIEDNGNKLTLEVQEETASIHYQVISDFRDEGEVYSLAELYDIANATVEGKIRQTEKDGFSLETIHDTVVPVPTFIKVKK